MESNLDIKILMIDDEEDVRDIFKQIMGKEYGYTSIETSDSIENAKETFKKKHFDILIIDMRFNSEPRGFELLELGDDDSPLASNMIIFTANDDVMNCRKSFQMGAWDYIPKNLIDHNPYEEMHNSIQKAIEHTNTWGNEKDGHWVNENIDNIMEKYNGEYIAVMDNKVIANAKTKEELDKVIKDEDLPIVMPLKLKVQ
jgi:DNA-binding NtrC family response regulator